MKSQGLKITLVTCCIRLPLITLKYRSSIGSCGYRTGPNSDAFYAGDQTQVCAHLSEIWRSRIGAGWNIYIQNTHIFTDHLLYGLLSQDLVASIPPSKKSHRFFSEKERNTEVKNAVLTMLLSNHG